LVIGTDVQAYDATYLVGSDIGGTVQAYDTDLAAIAGLSNANGNFIVGSVSGWIVESGSTARTSLGLVIGTDVQAYDATYVVDADIGVNVQAYDATIVVDADLGTSALLDTAAVTDAATTVATGNQIYDFVIGLSYITASSTDTLTNKTLASDSVTWS